jgi:hypothetical protein
MKKFFIVFVVFVLAFTSVSEARPTNYSIRIHYGTPDGKGGCISGTGICGITLSLTIAAPAPTDQESQTMDVKGEITNNLLVMNLPVAIKEIGKNTKGAFTFTILKETDVDPAIAKGLGVEKLIILPGKYEIKGNKLSLKIKAAKAKYDVKVNK